MWPLTTILVLTISINYFFTPNPIGFSLQKPSRFILDQKTAPFIPLPKTGMASFLWVNFLLNNPDHRENQSPSSSFQELRSIIETFDNFFWIYNYSVPYLNIIKDDLVGAEYFCQKGLKLFPSKNSLLLNCAFLAGFEMNNNHLAVQRYEKAINNDSIPLYHRILYSVLIKESQVLNDRIKTEILSNLIKNEENSLFKERLIEKVENLNR